MKKKLLALALVAGAAAPAFAQIGVSIGINQPGVYGRIDIGNYPQPAVVNARPVVVGEIAGHRDRRPIYLYVPLAYQQNWGRYCGQYNACNQPVYFVQEQWVRERYQNEHPGWRGDDRHDNGQHRGDDRGRGHGNDDHGHDRGGDRH